MTCAQKCSGAPKPPQCDVKVTEAVAEAETATQAALASGLIHDAAREGGRAADFARLIPFLPPTSLDESVVADARAKAVAYVRAAQATVPTLPELSFSLEIAGWRSCGPTVVAITPPPAALVSDLEAERSVVAFVARRAPVTATVAAFHANAHMTPVLQLLDTAQGLVAMIEKFSADVTELAETITRTNKARSKAGLGWVAPGGISTPELVALASHR